jgi:hypothetical protein
MKLTEILKSIQIEPSYLYHATYKPLLKKKRKRFRYT